MGKMTLSVTQSSTSSWVEVVLIVGLGAVLVGLMVLCVVVVVAVLVVEVVEVVHW